MAASNFQYVNLSLYSQDSNDIPTAITMFSGSDNTTGKVRLLSSVNVSGKSKMAALTGNRFEPQLIYTIPTKFHGVLAEYSIRNRKPGIQDGNHLTTNTYSLNDRRGKINLLHI